jgi:glycosyltransferase involved in cell wall biosynthesis
MKFEDIEGVEVTGFVPDLNAVLNQSSVFVAPMRFGAGIQNKVLEAMAAGKPVVTTSIVNQGLGAESDRDLLVADNATSFADSVLSLLTDAERHLALSESGREFVKARFNWNHVRKHVLDIQSNLST